MHKVNPWFGKLSCIKKILDLFVNLFLIYDQMY